MFAGIYAFITLSQIPQKLHMQLKKEEAVCEVPAPVYILQEHSNVPIILLLCRHQLSHTSSTQLPGYNALSHCSLGLDLPAM